MAEVEIVREGHVARVVLNRPEKLNSLTEPMWGGLVRAFRELDADPSVRVVVLTGAGPHFCAGADIANLTHHHKSGEVVEAEESIASCRKPVIAAISGYCLGGGLLLAAACDLRIAATDSHYGLPPAKLGIVYPEAATRRFVALVGPAATKYLIFTGDRIDAARALHIGLVDELVPSDLLADRVRHVAEQMAGLSQLSIQATKEIVNTMAAGRPASELVARWVDAADSGPDLAEGIDAFAARRPPRFTWTPPVTPDPTPKSPMA